VMYIHFHTRDNNCEEFLMAKNPQNFFLPGHKKCNTVVSSGFDLCI
jgi:hypothetical protein